MGRKNSVIALVEVTLCHGKTGHVRWDEDEFDRWKSVSQLWPLLHMWPFTSYLTSVSPVYAYVISQLLIRAQF